MVGSGHAMAAFADEVCFTFRQFLTTVGSSAMNLTFRYIFLAPSTTPGSDVVRAAPSNLMKTGMASFMTAAIVRLCFPVFTVTLELDS
jgi:hypothetical protein